MPTGHNHYSNEFHYGWVLVLPMRSQFFLICRLSESFSTNSNQTFMLNVTQESFFFSPPLNLNLKLFKIILDSLCLFRYLNWHKKNLFLVFNQVALFTTQQLMIEVHPTQFKPTKATIQYHSSHFMILIQVFKF